MKERIVAVLGMVSLLTTLGCANLNGLLGHDKNKAETEKTAATQPETAPAPAPAIAASDTLTLTATVKGIDLKKRLVTLKPRNGKTFTIHAGEEVRNLAQVRVGDRVVMKYTEAMAIRINQDTSGGITSRRETLSGNRAAPGQKPAGSVRNTVETVANILAIDLKTRKVTFQGPLNTLTVKAPANININRLNVGDQVLLTYVEELAISVEPASTKQSARRK